MQGRRDLVIAMSVAEVFLLLLFVVWIASRAQAGVIDVPGLQRQVAALSKQVDALRKENAEAMAWKEAYRRFLEGMGYAIPATPSEQPVPINTGSGGNGGKDWPACDVGGNRLLQAGVIGGELRIRFLRGVRSLGVNSGASLSGESAESVLRQIEALQISSHCRYHYRLEFASDSDYRVGKQRLERVFYPDGEIQLAEATPQ